jgi:hypothetical protein
MHAHVRAAAITGISAVLLGTAASAVATESAGASGPVPWSAPYATASASGERWTERTGPTPTLVIKGKLSNSAEGCYSLWTKFNADLVPGVPRKQAELCGPGSVPVEVRRSYSFTTTGSLTVCKGTQNTQQCGPWQSVTSWPVTKPTG